MMLAPYVKNIFIKRKLNPDVLEDVFQELALKVCEDNGLLKGVENPLQYFYKAIVNEGVRMSSHVTEFFDYGKSFMSFPTPSLTDAETVTFVRELEGMFLDVVAKCFRLTPEELRYLLSTQDDIGVYLSEEKRVFVRWYLTILKRAFFEVQRDLYAGYGLYPRYEAFENYLMEEAEEQIYEHTL